MLTFVVLFKFTDALSGAMTAPFVIDLGFTRNEYAAIVKGVGLAALLAGGFAGGFVARALPLADQPVGRRAAAIGGQYRVLLGRRSGHSLAVAHLRHHGGELHQRHRHGDVRRLSVGAVPEPAAHGDAIRAADRARRGRPHLSVVGRGLHCRGDRLGLVLRDLRARRHSEPHPARLAAAPRPFQAAGSEARPRTTSAA